MKSIHIFEKITKKLKLNQYILGKFNNATLRMKKELWQVRKYFAHSLMEQKSAGNRSRIGNFYS